MHPKRTETVLSVMTDGHGLEHAAGVSTHDLGAILDAVEADPNLTPEERETSIHWTAVDDKADFYTEVSSLARRFLLHPKATVDTLRVTDENARSTPDARFGATVSPAEYESGMVTGVKGSIPYGSLKIRTTVRSDGYVYGVISQDVLENDPRE